MLWTDFCLCSFTMTDLDFKTALSAPRQVLMALQSKYGISACSRWIRRLYSFYVRHVSINRCRRLRTSQLAIWRVSLVHGNRQAIQITQCTMRRRNFIRVHVYGIGNYIITRKTWLSLCLWQISTLLPSTSLTANQCTINESVITTNNECIQLINSQSHSRGYSL